MSPSIASHYNVVMNTVVYINCFSITCNNYNSNNILRYTDLYKSIQEYTDIFKQYTVTVTVTTSFGSVSDFDRAAPPICTQVCF